MFESETYKSPADFCRSRGWVDGTRIKFTVSEADGSATEGVSVGRITVGETAVGYKQEGCWFDDVYTATADATWQELRLRDLLAAVRLGGPSAKPAEPAIPIADAGTARSYWAALGPRLREKAGDLGYALAAFGPLNQVLDLLAFPWRRDAVEAPVLAEALRGVCCGSYIWRARGEAYTLAGAPGDSPHGRLTWGIRLTNGDDDPVVQLSVAPKWPRNDADPVKVAAYLHNRTRSGRGVDHAAFMELLRGGRFDVSPVPPPPCDCGGPPVVQIGGTIRTVCADCGRVLLEDEK